AQFPGERNWGYDGVGLFAAQHTYGGPLELMKLVDAAHAHGLAVLLDVVYNHLGPEGNYLAEFGPYYCDNRHTPWGPALNFDGRHCDGARRLALENVWQWIHDFHFDGLRLDAVHAMHDDGPRHILREIKETADAAAACHGRSACVVAESLRNDVHVVLPPESGGHGLDAEWNEDFHHAALAFFTGERHGKYVDFGAAGDLKTALEETFVLAGKFSRFRGQPWGKPAGAVPGDRFVIGLQNHDHVGNRAQGERAAALVAPPLQRMAAGLMLLAPYVPLIFMGEEYGETRPFLFFTSFDDPRLVEAVRSGRRRDYDLLGDVPDPQDPETFRRSLVTWSWPPGSAQAGLRALYADLLAARRTWPALADYERRRARLWPDEAQPAVLELLRGGDAPDVDVTVTAYFNLTDQPQPLPGEHPTGQTVLFHSEHGVYRGQTQAAAPSVDPLPPHAAVVFGPAGWPVFPAT
ncbi:MAG: DUF3459 domain-containing protein, partial [Planctomycetales bacterium]|nr:DUF3459 domain-containing protein [Planctomycetales bacterium]